MPSQEKSVFVKLKLKSADFKDGVKDSKEEVKNFAKGSVIALAAVTAAFAATTAVVASLVFKQAELANKTVDLSDQLGTSASELAALSKAAFEFGIEQDGFTQGLLKMRMALGQAVDGTGEQADALRDLGIAYDDIAHQDATQQFKTITDALHELTDENERAALSQALLGRNLGKTANAMARVEGTAERLLQGGKGLIGVDDKDLNLLASIPIELDKVHTVFGSIFSRIGAEASPAIQGLLGEITEMGIVFREEFLDGSIDAFLTEKAPEMIASFVSLTQASLDFTTDAISGFSELFGIVDDGAGKTTVLTEVINSASDVLATGREQLALKFLETAEAIANIILLPFTTMAQNILIPFELLLKGAAELAEAFGEKGIAQEIRAVALDVERMSLELDNPIDFTETKKDLNTIIDLTAKERQDERTHREEMMKKKMREIKEEAAAKVEARKNERIMRGFAAKHTNELIKQGKMELSGIEITIGDPVEEKKKEAKKEEVKRDIKQVKFAGLLQRGTAEEARISGGQQNQREVKILKATEKIAKNTDPKKNKPFVVKF